MNLIIVGAGDYAEVAIHYLKAETDYNILAVSVEESFLPQSAELQLFCGLPMVKFEALQELYDPENTEVLVAVGPGRVNTTRERLYLETRDKGFRLIKFIHSQAHVADPTKVGENSFVFPFVCLEPGSLVGNNCVLWSGSQIAHHSVVEDNCFLAPGARVSGRSTIKSNCFLGINATVRDHVTVSSRCIVGAGAVIKKDTVAGGVYSATPGCLLGQDSINTKI